MTLAADGAMTTAMRYPLILLVLAGMLGAAGCTQPQVGVVSNTWCGTGVLDDFEDGDGDLCTTWKGVWHVRASDDTVVVTPEKDAVLIPEPVSGVGNNDDGGASDAAPPRASTRALSISASLAASPQGWVAIEAAFGAGADLSKAVKITYRALATVTLQEISTFACEGCTGDGLAQDRALVPNVWAERTVNLDSGPNGAGPETRANLAAIQSLQIRVGSAAGIAPPNGNFQLWIDDVRLVLAP